MRRLVRSSVVALLVAFALVSVYAAASALWQPRGSVGLVDDYGAVVRAVDPGGPAALAGIAAGDRLDLAATPFAERRYVAGVGAAMPIGTVVNVRFVRDGVGHDVALVAVEAELTQADRFTVLLQCAASLVFIAVGATLIVVRPGAATWGFGLYCLLVLPTANDPFRYLPATAAFGALIAYDVLQNVGVIGLVVFALAFPRPFDVVWRARVRAWLPALFVVLAAMTAYPDVANLRLARGAGVENRILQLAFGGTFALALFLVYDAYRRIASEERERLRWVLAGFTFGLALSFVGTTLLFSSLFPFDPPLWLSNVLVSLNVLLPLAVGHAVVRHRVLDIDFVIGRALVYAALTTILALLFGLLDWFFGNVLEEFRLSRVVEAAIAVGIAFAFDALHARTERAIEAIFFRKRRAADERIARLTRMLPEARRAATVEDALVEEASDAFELTSAALFRQAPGGGPFVRIAALGWDGADCAALDDADLLLLALRSGKRPVALATLPWERPDVPFGPRSPIVAVPLASRADLVGFVLYGGHPGGGDVDPAELAALERLALAASVAFDALATERLRDENARERARADALEARLDELRLAGRPAAEPDPR